MADITIRLSADQFCDAHGGLAIVGPAEGGRLTAWVAYVPGQAPCICDTFEDAVDVLREALNPRMAKKAARKGKR